MGNAFVVNRLVKLPLTSAVVTIPPLILFGFLGGDMGLVEKFEKCGSS
jgi:hypothetical protein